jgi:predicted O-methyltransferase YrrM
MNHFYDDKYKFPENWFTFPRLYTYFINRINNGGSIIEIGSYKGQSTVYMAVEIANSNKKIDFYAIDTWEGSTENIDRLSPYFNQNINDLYTTYLKNIEKVKKYICNIKSKSVEAAKLFSDESIDIVFIDACHEYKSVCEDILTWLPKVKRGGLLAGHDYNHGWPGVNAAVDEILGAHNIKTQEYCWIYDVK